PLSKAGDPDFFSAELDAVLLAGDVDVCVHSLKDLPPSRPSGIRLAAMPARDDPRDVVVFRPGVIDRLLAGAPLRLGSSSDRRQRNVADFLAEALPATGQSPVLDFHPLRGAVDQRLARLHLPVDEPAALDGVILA